MKDLKHFGYFSSLGVSSSLLQLHGGQLRQQQGRAVAGAGAEQW